MSNDLISRKALIEKLNRFAPEHYSALVNDLIVKQPTAFDKEKVIEELKSWEKASYNTGIARAYSGLDRKASECYQESRAYHRAVEIIEKGGIE